MFPRRSFLPIHDSNHSCVVLVLVFVVMVVNDLSGRERTRRLRGFLNTATTTVFRMLVTRVVS